jgi:dihydroorotase
VRGGQMDLSSAIARLTSGPASVLGIDAGTLTAGSAADVCIFDPDQEWSLAAGQMKSRGHNTPFLDVPLHGRVTHTLLAGKVVYEQAAS